MLVCKSPVRPKAASRPRPATAGGRTSGSSPSVMSADRPRKRLVARRYAVGVPSTRMSACARSVVFRLTTSASVTTELPSCATRRAGETRANTAMTGSARKARLTKLAANTAIPATVRRIVGSPLDHYRCRLDYRRRGHPRLEAKFLDGVASHDRDDAGGLGDQDLDLREEALDLYGTH